MADPHGRNMPIGIFAKPRANADIAIPRDPECIEQCKKTAMLPFRNSITASSASWACGWKGDGLPLRDGNTPQTPVSWQKRPAVK